MQHRFLALLLFLGVFGSFSSQIFRGSILLNDNDRVFLNQILITNITKGQTVRADFLGDFQIPAQAGDVVRFSSLYTERKDVKITEKSLSLPQNIYLQMSARELETVIISGVKLTGNLKRDALSLKTSQKARQIKNAVGLPEPKYRNPMQQESVFAAGGGGLGLNLNALYDIISGERKKKIRLLKYQEMQQKVKSVHDFFGDEYFTSKKIPAYKIDEFLQFVYTSQGGILYISPDKINESSVYIERYLPIYLQRLRNSKFTTETDGKK